ncbi:MAG: Trm112 family protein [Chloroflexi bacterium]|nr:Trm112 family protein [Chloroflexota bacterium]MCL5275804.1 Trm112 family protein [Chloroflexota bacterium]
MANISTELLDILRCPHCVSGATRQPGADPGRLTLIKDYWLVQLECGRKYPIKDGIPIMLIEEGEKWLNTKIDDLPVPPPQN